MQMHETMGMAVRDAGGAGPCRDSRTRDSIGRPKDGSHIHTARKKHQPLTQTEEKGLVTKHGRREEGEDLRN